VKGRVDRRAALRRVGLAGLAGTGLAGLGVLWERALTQHSFSDGATHAGFTEIRHQLGWTKGVQFAGQYVAESRGFFKEERLDVRCIAGGPNTSFRSLVASGQALVSESVPTGLIEGAINGQPLVAFAAVLQRDPASLLSPADRPVRSLRDLVGKTVGAPSNVSAQIAELMRTAGLDARSVRFVPVGTDANMLAEGEVDAMYAWATTTLPSLLLRGFKTHVLNLMDIGAPSYGGVLFTRREELERDFDKFVRYTRALIRGWRIMVADPQGIAREIVQRWAPPGTSLDDQLLQAKTMVPYITANDGTRHGLLWIDPHVFEANARLMRAAGSIPKNARLDLSQLVTQDVVRKATATL